ncbi:hypothetical protein [Streptomyces sp. MBT33]|uniref:hypothetical protein n=1 Tax=Streptomyces sp. MBT33 TaxID=1488363 RepID=UPI00190DB7B4|nr:hypothetical protein [Streptomyces sp. MBT33]MBK3640466.1 hypothetical protein [Streptomyces sp. MBT33]
MMKQWQQLIMDTWRLMASTLLQDRIAELSNQRAQMERITMHPLSRQLPGTNVYFALPGEVMAMSDISEFQTVYAIAKLDDSAIAKLADAMAAGAVLVRYY